MGVNVGRFETARLVVCPLTQDDAPEMAALSDMPEISRWMSFMEGGFPLDKVRALIDAQGVETFFAVRERNGALAGGMATADHEDRTIEVGYWIGVAFQGRGYAFEALSGLIAAIKSMPAFASRPITAERVRTMSARSASYPRPAFSRPDARGRGRTGLNSRWSLSRRR